jgi:CBS domain-containing protein
VLGPGYEALRWAIDPERALAAVFVLATLRVIGTTAAVAGGGVGGLFIPLVMQGALLGRFATGLVGASNATLFPVVGMAAFLGAGYRVPLAAVVFVAEFTGRPGFVVPGLIAAVAAELVMGRTSVSPYQRSGRTGHLERRLRLPLRDVIDAEARTVPPDATVDELFWQHLVGGRRHAVPVVDDTTYLGTVFAADLQAIDRDRWATTHAIGVARSDAPVVGPDASIRGAIRAMESADVDLVVVCDGTTYVGVVTAADLMRIDQLLARDDD